MLALALLGCADPERRPPPETDTDTGTIDTFIPPVDTEPPPPTIDVAEVSTSQWLGGHGDYYFGPAFATFARPDGSLALIAEVQENDRYGELATFEVAAGSATTDDASGWIYGTLWDGFIGVDTRLRDLDGDGGDEIFLHLTLKGGDPVLESDMESGNVFPTPKAGESWYGDVGGVLLTAQDDPFQVFAFDIDRIGTGIPSVGIVPGVSGGPGLSTAFIFDAMLEGAFHVGDADQNLEGHAGCSYFASSPRVPIDFDGDGYEDLVAHSGLSAKAPLQDGWVSVLLGPIGERTSLDEAEYQIVPALGAAGDWRGLGNLTVADFDGNGTPDLEVGGRAEDYDVDPRWNLYVFETLSPGLSSLDDATATIPDAGSAYHTSAADLDGDGLADLLLYHNEVEDLEDMGGCLSVVWSPVSSRTGLSDSYLCNAAGRGSGQFGYEIDASRDVDGDGRADVFASAERDRATEVAGYGAIWLIPGAGMERLKL